MVSGNTIKNKCPRSRQLYQNGPKLGTPGATKVQPNCDNFRTFLHPGPEMGQESSRGPEKVAQGVQKVPKGFQKVSKRHEKAIHKVPNAMRKQQINQATKQRRNEATKQQQSNQATKRPSNKATNEATKQQQSNQATKQPSNKATKQQSNKATKQPRHPGTQVPRHPECFHRASKCNIQAHWDFYTMSSSIRNAISPLPPPPSSSPPNRDQHPKPGHTGGHQSESGRAWPRASKCNIQVQRLGPLAFGLPATVP